MVWRGLVLAGLVFAPLLASAHELTTGLTIARPSVVSVMPLWQGRPPNPDEPEGSGVVVGNGQEILTANHVLGNAETVFVRTFKGQVIPAKIKNRDKDTDIALLTIETRLPPAEFAGTVRPGEDVCALGNAFGLGVSSTCGVISAVERSDVGFNRIEDFVQTDAAVNPGASGGALIDDDGALVGLLSAIFTKQSDANIGVNFAVSARLTETVWQRLRHDQTMMVPDHGLRLARNPTPRSAGPVGALVLVVADGSAGETAGLQAGDVIVRAGSRTVRGPGDLIVQLVLSPKGFDLALSIKRGKESLDRKLNIPE